MEMKDYLSQRFIKALPVVFIAGISIFFPILESSVYGQNTWGRKGTSTYATLKDIWGTSANDIFAVGEEGAIIHYNGTEWHTMESTRENVYGFSLSGVWGSSSNNVYAVGNRDTILHYNGSNWSLVFGGNMAHEVSFSDVWGSSASDIFVVGSQGRIVHYDGNGWSYMDSGTSTDLGGVWGTSATDVFAVGSYGSILHYDGNTWSPMDSGTSESLFGVWGSSATDVYVVGSNSTILHYDGSTWSHMDVVLWVNLTDVWGTSDSDIFAVGHGMILHYNGNTWSPMAEGAKSLYGVWGSSTTNVYAVGNTVIIGSQTKRTILYYGNWKPNVLWTIPNREVIDWEAITDFVQTVGDHKSHLAFKLWCDPILADETSINVTNSHPAFTVNSSIDHIMCGSYYHINFDFDPTEPGLVRDKVTVAGDNDTIVIDIVGNGVPQETPKYWMADLTDVSAKRLAYDTARDLLYITDYNKHLLVVFSIKSRQIIHQIPVGWFPTGLAITPDGKRLYVANAGEYSITEINLETMGDVKTIPVPPLHPDPQVNPTPYDIAIIDEDTALIGGYAGAGSGGPIYELDLKTLYVSPRNDIGSGNQPVLRTSQDFSTTAILLEPYASPGTVARYDTASDSSISKWFDMERGVAINKNGARIAITWLFANVSHPNLRLVDRDLNNIMCIKLVEIPLGIDFDPTSEYIYATGGYNESTIEEVSTETLIQTRHLYYPMPEGYTQLSHPKTLVASKDGQWVYVILNNNPSETLSSKVLAVRIIPEPNFPKAAMPWIPLLLLDE